MDEHKRRPRLLRRIVKLVIQLVVACFLIVATILLVEAFRARGMPELQTWHTIVPAGEFRAADAVPGFEFDDYLALEDQLFKELSAYMLSPSDLQGHSLVIRYVKGGPGDPATFDPNWNRSTELVPASGDIVGGVLLLHGLTDSPYSLRSIAKHFHDKGFYTLCLRMPGHGTVPAALLNVSWRDWVAATDIAMRHVRAKVGPGKPIYLCGYSNGGAVAMIHTLHALATAAPIPDRVFLFSPAIGITPFAVASNWHMLFSWMPYFVKSKWLSIEPEYDPFKYNSFPKNAGAQTWAVTREIQRELDRAAADGRLARMPPVLTFQSTVDSTIIARDVVTRLYNRLPANGSELVVFDVNHASLLDGFFLHSRTPLEELLQNQSLQYALTVVQNADAKSMAMVARTNLPDDAELHEESLDLRWPRQVFSLAHVAIPFPPDDVMYGDGASDPDNLRLRIGDLSLRGERDVLKISANDLMRLRHNPFHAYMVKRIEQALRR